MKKIVLGVFAAALFATAACNEDEKKNEKEGSNNQSSEESASNGVVKLDYDPVTGTIETGTNVKAEPLNYTHYDDVYRCLTVRVTGGQLIICDAYEHFDTIANALDTGVYQLHYDVKVLERTNDLIIFSEMDEVDGSTEKQEVYGFFMEVKKGDKRFIVRSEGENPFEMVKKREDLDAMIAIARTIKPE